MKTKLPKMIKTPEEAKKFLLELIANNEVFHPEDDAHDILWNTCDPTHEEKEQLNVLMHDIYRVADFDPCGFILDNQGFPR